MRFLCGIISPFKIHLLRVRFDDGELRLFDGRILEGGVFAPLASARVFADWKLDYETLTWNDGDIDILADYVLNHSQLLESQQS